jgi:protocatechuate 3,4-dioxygenase beta subunit
MRRKAVVISALIALGLLGVSLWTIQNLAGRAGGPGGREIAGSQARTLSPDGAGSLTQVPQDEGREPAGGIPESAGGPESGEASRAAGGATTTGSSTGRSGSALPAAGSTPAGASKAAPPSRKGDSAILVTVLDSEGRPMAGAMVEVDGPGGVRSEPTAAAGVAEVAGLAAGDYQIRVRPTQPGLPALFGARPVTVAAGERFQARCTVPLLDAEITGRVLDSEGKPVAEVEIDCSPLLLPGSGAIFMADVSSAGPVKSGADGSFRIQGLARVEHVLSTRPSPGRPQARATAVAGASEPVDIVLARKRSLTITGAVRDQKGEPVAEVQVVVSSHQAQPARSGVDGRFRVGLEYERGVVALAARKEGYAEADLLVPPIDIGEREEVEVSLLLEPLGEVGELSGLITEGPGGPAVPAQTVHLHSASLNARYQARSGQDGLYLFSEVRAAADYRLWVSPERGFRDFSAAPVEVAPGVSRMDIELEPLETGRLTGTMLDATGRPLPRFTLWVRSLSASGNAPAITGDERGRFSADEVPAGEVQLETRAAPWITVRGLTIEPGQTRQAEVLLGLGSGRLDGQVLSAGGPVARARLTLTWTGPAAPPAAAGALQTTVYREAASDSAGRFSFSGIGAGRAILTAGAPGFAERRESRDLSGGAEELRIELAPGPGS